MIQEIPYKYDPVYKIKAGTHRLSLHYEYNKVMLLKEKEGYVIYLSGSSFWEDFGGRRIICFPSGIGDITW